MSDAAHRTAEYLSVTEAAEYLRVSVSWLRKTQRRGQIRYAKLGARVVFDRRDLDEFVEAQKGSAREHAEPSS